MKICVTSTGSGLDSPADPRFGRCPYFVIVDPETMEYEAVPNQSADASGGAGIQAAQTVALKGAGVVVTGHAGPNAIQALEAAGIRIMTGASGTVSDAIEQYRDGRLDSGTAESDAGTGSGASTGGAGMGGGRGGGRGTGRGMGKGRGGGMRIREAPGPEN
jgi:predicted Fe-Mo cluster-binding NifX family protein